MVDILDGFQDGIDRSNTTDVSQETCNWCWNLPNTYPFGDHFCVAVSLARPEPLFGPSE